MNGTARTAGPRARIALIALLVVAPLAGCSGSRGSAPVDAARARAALGAALDGWKKGDAPAALNAGPAPVTVQDLDWVAGARLLDYQVTGEGKAEHVNLRIPVTLTLKTADGQEIRKDVNYVVGTSPIVTVFRALR